MIVCRIRSAHSIHLIGGLIPKRLLPCTASNSTLSTKERTYMLRRRLLGRVPRLLLLRLAPRWHHHHTAPRPRRLWMLPRHRHAGLLLWLPLLLRHLRGVPTGGIRARARRPRRLLVRMGHGRASRQSPSFPACLCAYGCDASSGRVRRGWRWWVVAPGWLARRRPPHRSISSNCSGDDGFQVAAVGLCRTSTKMCPSSCSRPLH